MSYARFAGAQDGRCSAGARSDCRDGSAAGDGAGGARRTGASRRECTGVTHGVPAGAGRMDDPVRDPGGIGTARTGLGRGGASGSAEENTLDLRGLGPVRVTGLSADAGGNGWNGTVEFMNDDGSVAGMLMFRGIGSIRGCRPDLPPAVNDGRAAAAAGAPAAANLPTAASPAGGAAAALPAAAMHGPCTAAAAGKPGRASAGSGPEATGCPVPRAEGGAGTKAVGMAATPVTAAAVAPEDEVVTAFGTPFTFAMLAGGDDGDGNPLAICGVPAAQRGSVRANPDGTLTYAPAAGYSGPDTITCEVRVGRGDIGTAVVAVWVGAPAPGGIVGSAGGAQAIGRGHAGGSAPRAGDARVPPGRGLPIAAGGRSDIGGRRTPPREGRDVLAGAIARDGIESVTPCFTPGTIIATPLGERPVEQLRPGDKVITRDDGIQEIRWIGNRTLDWRTLGVQPGFRPVLVRKGALGHGLPERDMLVSPNHRVLITSDSVRPGFEERELLVAAKHLANNAGIGVAQCLGATYIHFMFDRHQLVLSDGAWTESFQPDEMSMRGIGNAQRQEIFALFPDLRRPEGIAGYAAARPTLERHDADSLSGRVCAGHRGEAHGVAAPAGRAGPATGAGPGAGSAPH